MDWEFVKNLDTLPLIDCQENKQYIQEITVADRALFPVLNLTVDMLIKNVVPANENGIMCTSNPSTNQQQLKPCQYFHNHPIYT